MTIIAHAALQKQVRLLTGKPLSRLSLAALEIALEGLGVPAHLRREELQKAIQLGRDQAVERRARKEARREAAP
nr:hypothetical protein [uncultured Duganella sp.]